MGRTLLMDTLLTLIIVGSVLACSGLLGAKVKENAAGLLTIAFIFSLFFYIAGA